MNAFTSRLAPALKNLEQEFSDYIVVGLPRDISEQPVLIKKGVSVRLSALVTLAKKEITSGAAGHSGSKHATW
jgi:hypothetical protein